MYKKCFIISRIILFFLYYMWCFVSFAGGYENSEHTLTGSTPTVTSSLVVQLRGGLIASCTNPVYLFSLARSFSLISSPVFHLLSLPLS